MPNINIRSVRRYIRISLSACLLSLVACGGPSSEESIARAEERIAEGDFAAAIVDLKNAASEGGEELPRVRWLLGKIYLETGDTISAEKELERARELGWNPDDVMPALAKSLLAQGKLESVAELPVDKLEPKAKAQVLAAQAQVQLALGNTWEADSLIATALELQPDDVDVALAEVRLMGGVGDIEGALAAVDDVLDKAPRNPTAWSLKGEFLRLQQRLEEALAALDKAIELNPDSFNDRSKRALINVQLQRMDAARRDADWLLRASPQNPMSNYVQGLLLFHDGDYADSITALSLAAPLAAQYPLVSFYLSAAHLTEGNREAAENAARRLVNSHPNFSPGRKLLANIYLQAGDAESSQELLKPVLDNDPDDVRALNLMASALLLDGKTDQGLDLLAKAQKLDPDSAEANFRLGAGLYLAGEDEAATQQLAKALSLDPKYQRADVLLILRLLEGQDFSAAIEAAEAYRARNPLSVAAHGLLGRVYLANEQIDEAVAAYDQALIIEPGDPAANQALAGIALQSGDVDKARMHYQAILDQRADYLPALLQLALLEAGQGNEEAMTAHLNHALTAHPEALQPRLMLGRYYLWKNEPARVPPLFSTLTKLQQQSPQVLHLLALSQLTEQRHSDAVYTLQQLVQMEPDTVLAHHLLGTAAAGAGDFDLARQEFQQALALDENYPPTLVALARLAWADGDNALFEQHLQKLTELAADAPDVLRLQAAASWRAGDQAQAIELAGRALDAAPRTDTLLELAGYQFMAGNSAESLRIVENWVTQHPEDVSARMALASQFTRAGSNDRAIKQYEAVLELEPENTVALNNLAWILRTSRQEQALDYARRAVSIEPGAAGLLDTLAVVEHLAGNNVQAQRHILRALAASPDNPVFLYHQALIEAALGNNTAAIGLLEKVLAGDSPAFRQRNEAETLLASLRQ